MLNKKIALQYRFIDKEDSKSAFIENDLIRLLDSIRKTGSLSASSKELGFSYRHLWNEVNRWEEKFDKKLLDRKRGQSGVLTPFAEKLLWAEKEVQAKYAEEIIQLRTSIEQAFAKVLNDNDSEIQVSGCPDEAVLLLQSMLTEQNLYLDVNFNSSKKGLEDLRDGKVCLAGFNFPLGAGKGSEAALTFGSLLDKDKHVLIRFCRRIQGLAVAKNNPLNICSLLDVSLKQARYVNRAEGTGTRILCDEIMQSSGLLPSEINGYDNIAPSHSQVAVMIASGKADAGICLGSIAIREDLGFVPLVKEVYLLATTRDFIETEVGRLLISLLKSDGLIGKISLLSGYEFINCGEILEIKQLHW